MPHNNRMSTSASLKTHAIWQTAIGHDPYANAEEKQDMIFWVKDIQDELGITILLIEHDMTMVMDISDRILAINFGSIITEGTPQEVQKHPEVLKAYLGEE